METDDLKLPVYLDYNATTPVDPAVIAEMLPYFVERWGNPASAHAYGEDAAAGLATARAQVGRLIGCEPADLVFTSCASESDNLAIKGVAFALRERGRHLITTAVEHPAVLNACRWLEQEFGFALTVIPVGPDGRIDPEDVRRAIRPDTILISVMHAQNETGALQPVAEVGRIARSGGILFHVDAAQSVGKIPVSVAELGCDLLTIAGHKLYAPKGVGALYVRDGVKLHPLIHGASYESGRRAGTANVPYAVALGKACELAATHLAAGEAARLEQLRDRLHMTLAEHLPVKLNGPEVERLPNTLNLSVDIPGLITNDLLATMGDVAASTGSACHSGISKPNETLLAMGVSPALAMSPLRLSLGRYTTAADVDFAAERLIRTILQ
ncbi:MAG TPA: cysteine desulfurase family protein [Symbiobacteriaceae bacterium]